MNATQFHAQWLMQPIDLCLKKLTISGYKVDVGQNYILAIKEKATKLFSFDPNTRLVLVVRFRYSELHKYQTVSRLKVGKTAHSLSPIYN